MIFNLLYVKWKSIFGKLQHDVEIFKNTKRTKNMLKNGIYGIKMILKRIEIEYDTIQK